MRSGSVLPCAHWRSVSGMPVSPAITDGSHAPDGVAENMMPSLSMALYMHIGDITTRLGIVSERSVIGVNIGGGGRFALVIAPPAMALST